MAGKISVIGEVPVKATLAFGERGAEVLVVAAGEDVTSAARLAPSAVLVLVDADPAAVTRALEATLWPRQRIVGVAAGDAERAVAALTGGDEVTLAGVLRDGEAPVTLGRGGVLAVG